MHRTPNMQARCSAAYAASASVSPFAFVEPAAAGRGKASRTGTEVLVYYAGFMKFDRHRPITAPCASPAEFDPRVSCSRLGDGLPRQAGDDPKVLLRIVPATLRLRRRRLVVPAKVREGRTGNHSRCNIGAPPSRRFRGGRRRKSFDTFAPDRIRQPRLTNPACGLPPRAGRAHRSAPPASPRPLSSPPSVAPPWCCWTRT